MGRSTSPRGAGVHLRCRPQHQGRKGKGQTQKGLWKSASRRSQHSPAAMVSQPQGCKVGAAEERAHRHSTAGAFHCWLPRQPWEGRVLSRLQFKAESILHSKDGPVLLSSASLGCYHTPAEAGGCPCPLSLPRLSSACGRGRLVTLPAPSSGARWQAVEKSSPVVVLPACWSGAVTGCEWAAASQPFAESPRAGQE